MGKETQKPEEQTSKHPDTIEISSKAQELNKTLDTGKNLDVIREKVKSGFYNSEEVLNKVADAILTEIKSK